VKSLVIIREVPDTEATIIINSDGKTINTSDLKYILNPYDEYAVEEGTTLQETNGGESVLLAIGGADMTKIIRNAIAGNIAFSKVIHLVTNEPNESFAASQKIADVIKEENPDIVFLGKQYIDDDDYLMAPFVADALGYECATVVTSVTYNDGNADVVREIEGGSEHLNISFPAVISLQKGVNDPRYAGMKGIMKAKKVAIETRDITLDNQHVEVLSIENPPQKAAGRIIDGDNAVEDLVKALKEEAKVL
jgi:electron transfer flavoprotein beta subunit